MKTERTIYIKLEMPNHHTAVVTLVTPDGLEVASEVTQFDANYDRFIGATLRSLVQRAEHHYAK